MAVWLSNTEQDIVYESLYLTCIFDVKFNTKLTTIKSIKQLKRNFLRLILPIEQRYMYATIILY